jgi:4'-phosphopantetheinyl transferase
MSPILPRRIAAHRADGPDDRWTWVGDDLARTGVVLAHASITAWQGAFPDQTERRRLLGRDWTRYRAGTGRPGNEQFLATRMLLKHLAARALDTDPADLELGYALSGRLYVRGCDQVDLNLSHTGDLMVVGLTSLGRIGVDVEAVDRPLYRNGTEEQMCTPAELDLLRATPEEQRNLRLVRQWTLKEAYTKALGLGLYFPFNQFGFQVDSDPPTLHRPDGSSAEDARWSFRSLPVADGFMAGLALHRTGPGQPGDTRAATAFDPRTLGAVNRALRSAAR